MIRRYCFALLLLFVVFPVYAQDDAFNLPAALYVLTNDGVIQRYGQGAEGITSVSPPDRFVVDFGVAPDDTWIAYRTEETLALLNRQTGEEKPMEGGGAADIPPFRGAGDTIVWAPGADALAVTRSSGGRIYFGTDAGTLPAAGMTTYVDLREGAFVQFLWSPDGRYLAGEVEDHIWWIYRREGQNMLLTSAIPSAVGAAWVNNSELVFTPPEGGLILMNLGKANAQTLLLGDGSNYSLPYLRSDGLLVFFGRQKNDTQTEPGFGWLLGLRPGGAALEDLGESPVDLADLRWAPGGEFLISFRAGIFSVVNPINAQSFALPVSAVVAYGWGPLTL
jgi:hypothetical protein